MTKVSTFVLVIAVALVATQGAFAVDTSLTDYSRAVMLENPTYYWTFNESGATDVAQEVMRYETESQMQPVVDATRTSSYSTELGSAASFNDNAAFWAQMINRGTETGAYAIEYWFKADVDSGAGYVFDPLGAAVGGNSPAVIHGFNANTTELFYYTGDRTGSQSDLLFNDGQWHHVVFAVNCDGATTTSDQIDIAVDGVVTTNFMSLPTAKLDLTGAICLGACKPTSAPGVNDYATAAEAGGVWDGFSGQIDEFAVYDLSGMDTAAVATKLSSLASHYSLATSATAITPFAAVDAADVSYSVIGGDPVSPSYDDSTGSELSDAAFCGDASLEKSVGFYGSDTYTELEFDLGDVSTLDSVWIDYVGAGGKWGINAPASVELSFSTDGVNFSDTVTFEDFNNTTDDAQTYWNERCAQVGIDSVEAQYVRAKFNHNGVFLFLSEVRFMEEVSALIAGDANNDGKVDGSDVTILAGNWQKGVSDGLTASWEEGDFNGDGKVDGSDVTILAGNWQYGVEAAASAVPEPGTIVLLISAIASLLIWRRGR